MLSGSSSNNTNNDGVWRYQSQSAQAGRSSTRYASSQSVNAGLSSAGSGYRSTLSRSYMADEPRAGAYTSRPPYGSSLSARSSTTPNMNLSTSTPMSPASAKSTPNLMHSKLHKRGSGSGTASTRAPMSTNTSEPFPDIVTPNQSNSAAKARPYLRKLSSAKDDQGRIDLSKPLAENEKLAGLGIQEYTTKPEAAFSPAGRSHARTTSVGSQMSSSSGTRPLPFVHPMRQSPRPFTPTATRSQTSSPQEGDDDDDFVDEDYRPGFAFRTRRSMSNSSTQIAPTPLSQTITAADLGTLPRLANTSQSNLSIVSTSSKPTGSRRNTNRSQETAISPSSRTSFDRPFGPRRSDTEAQTRDERIQAARRKFQEKEAGKDRKAEKEAVKRREAEEMREQKRQQRERGKSDASDRARMQRPAIGARAGSALGLNSPIMAYQEPTTEKQPGSLQSSAQPEKAGLFARLFGCAGRRK